MKTKRVAGCIDLPSSAFAYVGDLEDPATWKLPLLFPGDAAKTRNLIKSAVDRFASTKIADEQRAETWRLIAGAAKAHGISVGQQPKPSALPVNAHPYAAHPAVALDAETKAARALAELQAERLIEQIGNWWDR